jgi:hypothetical protein
VLVRGRLGRLGVLLCLSLRIDRGGLLLTRQLDADLEKKKRRIIDRR